MGTPQYTDLREMIRKEELDVIHVCTPSGFHLEPCTIAMEAGKHVIVEKPLEIQTDRIDQMLEAQNERRRRSGRPELTEEGMRAEVYAAQRQLKQRSDAYRAEDG